MLPKLQAARGTLRQNPTVLPDFPEMSHASSFAVQFGHTGRGLQFRRSAIHRLILAVTLEEGFEKDIGSHVISERSRDNADSHFAPWRARSFVPVGLLV